MVARKDAQYMFDLLQICLGLKFGDESYFSSILKQRYGGSSEDRPFVGLEQAVAFLCEVYSKDELFSDELKKNLKINKLINLLDINIDDLPIIKKPSLSFSAAPEGATLNSDVLYFGFETTAFFMSLVVITMDRIVEFQSRVTKDTRGFIEIAEKYGKLTGSSPAILNLGSSRQYNATLSAYFARARHIGGTERFIDEGLKQLAQTYSDEKMPFDTWYLKSNEVIQYLNNTTNNSKFESQTTSAAELIAGGLYRMDKTQYVQPTMLSFALDGDVANTYHASAGGASDFLVVDDNSTMVVDSKYQAIFDIKALERTAVYGVVGNVKVDSLRYLAKGYVRAKWNSIPKILVNNHMELSSVINNVKTSCVDKDVYFRGQGRHHNLERPASVKNFLYGDKNVCELSLPTAASRTGFDFDGFYPSLQLHMQGIFYSQIQAEKFKVKGDSLRTWAHFKSCDDVDVQVMHEKWFQLYGSYEWDLLVMALAQHYGIPTHGLDITNDINIALWFALHEFYRYEHEGQTYAWYKPAVRNQGSDVAKYPVIYVLATDKHLKRDLDQVEFSGIPSLRPIRQSAFLHYGGWGLHSNICAEDVVAVIHLSPQYVPPPLPSTAWLFPSESEDRFYAELLALKRLAIASGLNTGFSEIQEFRPE